MSWKPPPRQPERLWNTDENNPKVQARIGKSEDLTFDMAEADKKYALEVNRLRAQIMDNPTPKGGISHLWRR